MDGYNHGQKVAEMAIRILNGEKVKDIPALTKTTAQYMFNFDGLVRFGIGQSDLPKDRVIINEPYAFYEEYKSLVWATIFLMIALVAIIFILQVNIIKRKRSEEALEQLRRHNELILESAGEGIYGLDLNGNTTFVNPGTLGMIGYEAEELIDKPYHDIVHHSRHDGSPYPREECLVHAPHKDEAMHQVGEEVFWRKDGTSFPVEYTSAPIRDEQDEAVGAVVCFRDITERKQAEKALKESEENLRTLVESSTDSILTLDPIDGSPPATLLF